MNDDGAVDAVVLPGMDGTGELLTAFVQRLSRDRRVQLIPYPPAQPMGYGDLALYVQRRLRGERFIIVAESFAGPMAIEIAATNPRVSGLVLASSFASCPLPKILVPFAEKIELSMVPASFMAIALLGSSPKSELKDRLIRVVKGLPRDTLRKRLAEVLRVDKRVRLLDVACPILLLHGRHDRLVRRAHVEAISSSRVNCQVRWFDSPHMLLETNADAAAKAITEFCERA